MNLNKPISEMPLSELETISNMIAEEVKRRKEFEETFTKIYSHLVAISKVGHKKFRRESSEDKKQLFDLLPQTFCAAEAIEIGMGIKIPPRTVEYWLRNRDHYTKVRHGHYHKVITSQEQVQYENGEWSRDVEV